MESLTPIKSEHDSPSRENLERARMKGISISKHENPFLARSRSSPARPARFGALLVRRRNSGKTSGGGEPTAHELTSKESEHYRFPGPDSRGPFATMSGVADEPNFRKVFFAFLFMASALITTALLGVIAEMRIPNPKK